MAESGYTFRTPVHGNAFGAGGRGGSLWDKMQASFLIYSSKKREVTRIIKLEVCICESNKNSNTAG